MPARSQQDASLRLFDLRFIVRPNSSTKTQSFGDGGRRSFQCRSSETITGAIFIDMVSVAPLNREKKFLRFLVRSRSNLVAHHGAILSHWQVKRAPCRLVHFCRVTEELLFTGLPQRRTLRSFDTEFLLARTLRFWKRRSTAWGYVMKNKLFLTIFLMAAFHVLMLFLIFATALRLNFI